MPKFITMGECQSDPSASLLNNSVQTLSFSTLNKCTVIREFDQEN